MKKAPILNREELIAVAARLIDGAQALREFLVNLGELEQRIADLERRVMTTARMIDATDVLAGKRARGRDQLAFANTIVSSATETVDDSAAPYSVEEAAKIAGLNTKTMYAAVRDGSVPAIRIGRKILIPREAFDRLLAEGKKS